MNRVHKIATLHRLLMTNRQGVTMAQMTQAIQGSRHTVYRILAVLEKDFLVPVQVSGGPERLWSCARGDTEQLQLPGLWLSADQLFGLRLAERLVQHGGGGDLAERLGTVGPRMKKILGEQEQELDRLRILHSQFRIVDPAVFRCVAEANHRRVQLRFRYRGRTTTEKEARERHVCPQLLTRYRENWYLDAWDHGRNALRSFSLDLIGAPRLIEAPARQIPKAELESYLQTGYGFYAGAHLTWATIRFSTNVARWVAAEHWHDQQRMRHRADGSLELRLPYANARQLLMDVLKYGFDAEVLSPKVLRQEMAAIVEQMQRAYQAKPDPRKRAPR